MAVKSRVAILLDSSSSMNSIREEVIDAFNEQVTTLKSDENELPTKVSLITFGSKVNDPILWNRRLSRLEALTEDTYKPSGMTALYDGMGTTIDKLNQLPEANDPDTNFLVVVISDGAENNSKEYQSSFLKKRIQELEKSGRWEFSYIGANQDMLTVSRDLGIKLGSTFAFNATADGVESMSKTYANATANYRGRLKKGIVGASMDFLEAANETIDIDDIPTNSTDRVTPEKKTA
jgi:Mg-chelatase subunit ChlD